MSFIMDNIISQQLFRFFVVPSRESQIILSLSNGNFRHNDP